MSNDQSAQKEAAPEKEMSMDEYMLHQEQSFEGGQSPENLYPLSELLSDSSQETEDAQDNKGTDEELSHEEESKEHDHQYYDGDYDPNSEQDSQDDEQDDDGDDENDDQDYQAADNEEKPAAKPNKTARKRISDLTQRVRLAESQVQELQQKMQESSNEQAPENKEDDQLKEPDVDDFDEGYLDPAYIDALKVYNEKSKELEFNKLKDLVRQTYREEVEYQKLSSQWKSIHSNGKKKYDDYDAKVGNLINDKQSFTPMIANITLNSKHSEDLLYHLSKHTDEAKEIAAMPEIMQAYALGKLEASFEHEPKSKGQAAQSKKHTKAPMIPSSQRRQSSVQPTSSESDDFLLADNEIKKLLFGS